MASKKPVNYQSVLDAAVKKLGAAKFQEATMRAKVLDGMNLPDGLIGRLARAVFGYYLATATSNYRGMKAGSVGFNLFKNEKTGKVNWDKADELIADAVKAGLIVKAGYRDKSNKFHALLFPSDGKPRESTNNSAQFFA